MAMKYEQQVLTPLQDRMDDLAYELNNALQGYDDDAEPLNIKVRFRHGFKKNLEDYARHIGVPPEDILSDDNKPIIITYSATVSGPHAHRAALMLENALGFAYVDDMAITPNADGSYTTRFSVFHPMNEETLNDIYDFSLQVFKFNELLQAVMQGERRIQEIEKSSGRNDYSTFYAELMEEDIGKVVAEVSFLTSDPALVQQARREGCKVESVSAKQHKGFTHKVLCHFPAGEKGLEDCQRFIEKITQAVERDSKLLASAIPDDSCGVTSPSHLQRVLDRRRTHTPQAREP